MSPPQYARDPFTLDDHLALALRHARDAWVVGTTEDYEALVCTLGLLVTGASLPACDCTVPRADVKNEKPGVFVHSRDNHDLTQLTADALLAAPTSRPGRIVEALTRRDRLFYAVARRRWLRDRNTTDTECRLRRQDPARAQVPFHLNTRAGGGWFPPPGSGL